MSLLTTAVTLVAYAVGFQTLVYLLLPGRFRRTWAPLVTGSVGAAVVVASAVWFGADTVGLNIGIKYFINNGFDSSSDYRLFFFD